MEKRLESIADEGMISSLPSDVQSLLKSSYSLHILSSEVIAEANRQIAELQLVIELSSRVCERAALLCGSGGRSTRIDTGVEQMRRSPWGTMLPVELREIYRGVTKLYGSAGEISRFSPKPYYPLSTIFRGVN